MISHLYNILIYKPLYNGLILLMDYIPWIDAGVAIIILTIIVKLVLFPLSKKSVTTQLRMKKVEPQLVILKEKYKDDKQEQARQTMALYKKEGISPFMGILLLFIQLPIILALYKVFLSSSFSSPNLDLLYPFVRAHVPSVININFLNLIDISGKSLILAIFAGVTSFIQIRYSLPPTPKKDPSAAPKSPSFKDDLARSMNMQMRYIFPILAFFISWSISGAIALYWITSNVFTLAQELFIRKTVRSKF